MSANDLTPTAQPSWYEALLRMFRGSPMGTTGTPMPVDPPMVDPGLYTNLTGTAQTHQGILPSLMYALGVHPGSASNTEKYRKAGRDAGLTDTEMGLSGTAQTDVPAEDNK